MRFTFAYQYLTKVSRPTQTEKMMTLLSWKFFTAELCKGLGYGKLTPLPSKSNNNANLFRDEMFNYVKNS
jgi:hypothetical protein